MQTLVDTVAAARGQIAAGKLKSLGITMPKPSALLPGVKTAPSRDCGDFAVTLIKAAGIKGD